MNPATPHFKRAWYSASIDDFRAADIDDVVNQLSGSGTFDVNLDQKEAWRSQCELLQPALEGKSGQLYFEFEIPRMGNRADVVLFMQGRVLVLEFKAGSKMFVGQDFDQAYDYALDLKYFHEGSHQRGIVPMLVATEAPPEPLELLAHPRQPGLYQPLRVAGSNLRAAIELALDELGGGETADAGSWERSRYLPTPTIVEAARALYAGHNVNDITRSDAGAEHLGRTRDYLREVARRKRSEGGKAICFVTGVPGAGKTLVGLDLAASKQGRAAAEDHVHCVYLSGNGPLVDVLREALARDSVDRAKEQGEMLLKGAARTKVKTFIQNIHHFRDEYLKDIVNPPADHVVIFDEAQRSWDKKQASNFMKRKRNIEGFDQSEPEFLLSCMERHTDWALVVCLVGGGQEINTGEAGIAEWLESLARSQDKWEVHVSPRLREDEYAARAALAQAAARTEVRYSDELHLAVSVRSYRAEKLSDFVTALLDLEEDKARQLLREIDVNKYPIWLTRSLPQARNWLRWQASGSERYGLLVSSQAERLKPYAVDVRTKIDYVKWFLNDKEDVRSSYYLEDVATQFHVQGLELDWTCVCWDGDFRHVNGSWSNHAFRGKKWERINAPERREYQKNAYRVLLTRARQGMVLCVPEGSKVDPTRNPEYYDGTYEYLRSLRIPELP